jgi:hypothetical protein
MISKMEVGLHSECSHREILKLLFIGDHRFSNIEERFKI